MKPAHQFLILSIVFTNVSTDTLNLSGNVRVSRLAGSDFLSLRNLDFQEKSFPLRNGQTDPILFVTCAVMNFDDLIIEANFTSLHITSESVQVTLTSQNRLVSQGLALIRVLYSLILLPGVFRHSRRWSSPSISTSTLDQRLADVLLFATLVFLSPFYYFNLVSPSPWHQVAVAVLRDFLAFWIVFFVL
jgi:hypothetical protein